MCDEYYDARMKAFWRSLAEAEADEELTETEDEAVITPISLDLVEPPKTKAKALLR